MSAQWILLAYWLPTNWHGNYSAPRRERSFYSPGLEPRRACQGAVLRLNGERYPSWSYLTDWYFMTSTMHFDFRTWKRTD